ncbi:MAG: hypothetical protein K0S33_2655 [Bacteroidetes bacterium]|nr:hypothetical protein [Bacteroidota bacterium]
MKKSVLALAMAFGVTGAFAQDLTSKKGEPYLPEAGDWSIGIDATPFFSYTKSLIGAGSGASSPTFNFLNGNNTIVGKMFKDEKTAYRAIVRIGFSGQTFKNNMAQAQSAAVVAAQSYPTVAPTVEEKAKVGSHLIGLGAGIEMRRGKTRLQGYYGGEAFLWQAGSKESFEYGNALTGAPGADPDVDPTSAFTTDFTTVSGYTGGANLVSDDGSVDHVAGRVIERKAGMTFGIGVRGFIGAEYFIFPKISIAGEFGWGLGYAMTGKSTMQVESESFTNPGGTYSTATIETETAGSSRFILDTDSNPISNNNFNIGGPNGTIRLNLHF